MFLLGSAVLQKLRSVKLWSKPGHTLALPFCCLFSYWFFISIALQVAVTLNSDWLGPNSPVGSRHLLRDSVSYSPCNRDAVGLWRRRGLSCGWNWWPHTQKKKHCWQYFANCTTLLVLWVLTTLLASYQADQRLSLKNDLKCVCFTCYLGKLLSSSRKDSGFFTNVYTRSVFKQMLHHSLLSLSNLFQLLLLIFLHLWNPNFFKHMIWSVIWHSF